MVFTNVTREYIRDWQLFIHITNRYRAIIVHKFGRFMQKIFSPRYKLRDCPQFIECRKILHVTEGDIYILFSTRFASAIWAGSTNAPALFLQSRFGLHRGRSRGALQTHACIKRGKNLTDGIALLVGQTLFCSFPFCLRRDARSRI